MRQQRDNGAGGGECEERELLHGEPGKASMRGRCRSAGTGARDASREASNPTAADTNGKVMICGLAISPRAKSNGDNEIAADLPTLPSPDGEKGWDAHCAYQR